tara:strand:+ start:5096 stop:5872 length:777 start_codon:yes stop_codon:yes gene_type:complete
MLEEISLIDKYFYHNCFSVITTLVTIYIGYNGYKLKNKKNIRFFSFCIIIFCLIQEVFDYINRLFLDNSYLFSIQQDLPFLQFCQISFYFSLLCIFYSNKRISPNKNYSLNQFFFDVSFLLGFSGAFQGIITPDFTSINNLLGVICIQLQHSLILLNIVWLMTVYNYRLKFKGLLFTFLLINYIAPFALTFNKMIGLSINGNPANYFYVNKLPEVDNFFLNLVSDYPSPDYILYIQPVFLCYFIALYFPFFIYDKMKK